MNAKPDENLTPSTITSSQNLSQAQLNEVIVASNTVVNTYLARQQKLAQLFSEDVMQQLAQAYDDLNSDSYSNGGKLALFSPSQSPENITADDIKFFKQVAEFAAQVGAELKTQISDGQVALDKENPNSDMNHALQAARIMTIAGNDITASLNGASRRIGDG